MDVKPVLRGDPMPSYSSEITIEEVSGTKGRKVTLRGPSLPHKGVTWGSNNRIPTTWYPGNPTEATQQILGPTEAPTTFEGTWRRTMMGKAPALYSETGGTAGFSEVNITTPWVLKELLESICREGARLRVTWTSQSSLIDGKIYTLVREGRASTITFTHDTESDIMWKIEWTWMNRGVSQQQVVALRGTDAVSEATELVTMLNDIATNFETDVVINFNNQSKKKGQGVPNLTFSQLNAIADYPNSVVNQFTRDCAKIGKDFQNAVDLVNKVTGIPGQLQNTVKQSMKNTSTIVKQYKQKITGQPAEESTQTNSASDIARTSTFFGQSVHQAEDLNKKVASVMGKFLEQFSRSGPGGAQVQSQQTQGTNVATVQKLYVAVQGDTPISVSIKFFSNSNMALAILQANSLPWTTTFFDPGKILIIPNHAVLLEV